MRTAHLPTVSLQWRIQDFPQGGAPTPKSAIIFQFFSQKLRENERIWTPRGARVPGAPLRSANALGIPYRGVGTQPLDIPIPPIPMSGWTYPLHGWT